ncbi:pseudouridine synthase [Oleidesulfovibrio sp.]|uniref:pseudouridine synthase n=1 Tax=Oleidesulfovibrio sp. TaxID=2909707 RepID=UPI003A882B15
MMKRITTAVTNYIKRVLISLDQAVNVIVFFGREDETVSARCWRLRSIFPWNIARWLIDLVALLFKDKNHCEVSYQSELQGRQLPKEYRPQDTAES